MGGYFTKSFLDLEKAMDDFASQWSLKPTAGNPLKLGHHDEFYQQIEVIKLLAKKLSEDAEEEQRQCSDILQDIKKQERIINLKT